MQVLTRSIIRLGDSPNAWVENNRSFHPQLHRLQERQVQHEVTTATYAYSEIIPSGQASAPAGYGPPARSPTESSYYDFHRTSSNGRSNGQTWMYARDARAQQAGASSVAVPRPNYPNYYGNKNAQPVHLSTPPEQIPNHRRPGTSSPGWLHHPLIPNHQTTHSGNLRTAGTVRSVYPLSDPSQFDVIYHTGGPGQFRNATYHPSTRN
ncbi:hypothetical protein EDB81DRAFT_255925 [Dactylonectria macrodidyma]|uniref:Uncharacterized protein n=1 Tax=Dactylonectria macrodidyma TaxID=307937 RepID=A0A9P9FKC9_9HYPO|nr:hypothetical protein EDB81DRAFT_255925 [Dactylonectria macrodidyma]